MSSAIIDHLITLAHQKQDQLAGFGQTVLLETKEGDFLFLDTCQTPIVIETVKKEADLTLICSRKLVEKLLAGKTSPLLAYGLGKLKLKGSMALAKDLAARLAQ